jgi:CheY-like chemotaxis protein
MNRIVTGKLVLDLQRLDVSRLLMAAGDILRPLALAKGVTLSVEEHGDSTPHVRGDAIRLQQVFANLLGNALKFTPAGGTISMAVRRREDAYIAVTVSDTGEGIDPLFLPHLFDRFSQANSKAARVHGGLGIGLSIVKQLTELHGGTVSGDSIGLGAGATFTVMLPAEPADHHAAPVPLEDDQPDIPAIDLSGIRVLLVDDNADILELSRRVLAECGATVVTVDSVPAALARLRDARPDVLISDISMPVLNGYDLIRTVRKDLHLDAQTLPAIAISAYARLLDRRRALEAGYQAYIVKPLQPHLLILAVAEAAAASARSVPHGTTDIAVI